MINTILANRDGGTIALNGSELPTTGYFVGGITSALVYGPQDGPEDVIEFVRYLDNLGAEYVGWWTDQETGALWIDGSDHFAQQWFAEGIARDRGEIAIYDIANQAEIRL